MATETPAYEVLRHEGDFELRRYEGYMTANVHVDAPSSTKAVNAGFNVLADFIFGNNRSSSRIAMTVPVSAGEEAGEKIAMTAPVGAEAEADPDCVSLTCMSGADSSAGYNVSFTMPSKYTLDTLPVPNDPRVKIETVGPHVAAVIRFSGYMSEDSRAEAETALAGWLAEQGLVAKGAPVAAQYDAPWKPWFARRNEIIVTVEEVSG